MKKTVSLLLAVILVLGLFTTAWADEAEQPEGGKKFEGSWAMRCGLIEVVYEEEGYRVLADLFNPETSGGTLWQYSCLYNEEADALISVSSSKNPYTMDMHTLEKVLGECEYEGIDEDGAESLFTLSGGALEWKEGHENAGQDLQFTHIGGFEGVWRNEAEDIYAEFHWQGLLNENLFCYDIFMSHGEKESHLAGWYNPETRKLECYDTAGVPTESDEDLFTAIDEGKPGDMVFSDLDGGRIQSETEEGMFILDYDILGPES